ncbi:hypothetical protein [Cytobacillus praedii]|uniref:hypothetical protein n=1 Tax=Cytobacillus praedii TaxID=1742358 RepID=UPI002E246E66|nr:hypothetical protein [Cytobacillus praedii]
MIGDRRIRKAEAACPGATSIRRAGWKVVFNLLARLAYDLEPLAAEARQSSNSKVINPDTIILLTRKILLLKTEDFST